MKEKFDFDDILIEGESVSDIDSRKEIKIYDDNGMLPLFTAPMLSVVDKENSKIFNENKIYSIIPRGINSSYVDSHKFNFVARSLEEFRLSFNVRHVLKLEEPIYVCIDIANGHMKKLHDEIKEAKDLFENKIIIIAGNVGSPGAFKELAKTGVDYIRCGIGNGNGCLTTQQTGVGYPMGSLIKECSLIKQQEGFSTKIIADGGFKKYADIIKALALGADYVMLGSIFNKALESAGKTLDGNFKEVDPTSQEVIDYVINPGPRCIYKEFYGMSTKHAQKIIGKSVDNLRTSEGIHKRQAVEYTLNGWVDNFVHYLSTAMSYTYSKDLSDFQQVKFNLITESAYNRFKK